MLERIHLAVVREVDRTGSLTAAASVLCLTQPALSHTIKKIEQQLGTPIWFREGRRLRLTQAGQHLLGVANRILPQLEHAEDTMKGFATGQRGALRIGMECHPCYQWLLRVVAPYLLAWPDVDVDVKQKFKFGGIGALFSHEIDLLVTPDPLYRPGLAFQAVFDYEQVLVVASNHPFAGRQFVTPEQLTGQTLITYPVGIERQDIYNLFLSPAGCAPANVKSIETTDIMLEMVAGGRGVAALPKWLAEEYAGKLPIAWVRLGVAGVPKQLFLGTRETDRAVDYIAGFVGTAQRCGTAPATQQPVKQDALR